MSYIIRLLKEYTCIEDQKARDLKLKEIKDIISSSIQRKSKRELIEKFIEKHSLNVSNEEIEDEFERFLNEEKMEQLQEICETNKLHLDKVEDIISKMPYYGSIPNIPNGREDIYKTFVNPPGLLQRDKAISDLIIELDDFIETFYEKGAA